MHFVLNCLCVVFVMYCLMFHGLCVDLLFVGVGVLMLMWLIAIQCVLLCGLCLFVFCVCFRGCVVVLV